MPWRLPAWAAITLPVAVTLKRFFAPDLVFSLGIWLSLWLQHDENAREGVTDIDTAALDQPGNEARPGAAITLTCGWIMWRLLPTRSSQGIASGCPDRHQASTPETSWKN